MADNWLDKVKGTASSFGSAPVVDTTPIAPVAPDPVETPSAAVEVPAYTPQTTKAGGAESLGLLKQYAAENGYYIDTGTSGDAPRFYKIVPGGVDEYGEPTKQSRVEVSPADDPFAKGLLQQFYSYTQSAAGKGTAAGDGSGSGGAAAKYVDPILAYLNSGEVALEEARSGEVSRQLKDAMSRLNALYDMEDSDQNYEANAIQGNLAQEKAWRSGAADWESPGARTMIGSRPSREIEQALQEQLALSLPDTIMPDYGLAGTYMMPGRQGFDDSNFNFDQWYAEGSRPIEMMPLRRFADGTSYSNPSERSLRWPLCRYITGCIIGSGCIGGGIAAICSRANLSAISHASANRAGFSNIFFSNSALSRTAKLKAASHTCTAAGSTPSSARLADIRIARSLTYMYCAFMSPFRSKYSAHRFTSDFASPRKGRPSGISTSSISPSFSASSSAA